MSNKSLFCSIFSRIIECLNSISQWGNVWALDISPVTMPNFFRSTWTSKLHQIEMFVIYFLVYPFPGLWNTSGNYCKTSRSRMLKSMNMSHFINYVRNEIVFVNSRRGQRWVFYFHYSLQIYSWVNSKGNLKIIAIFLWNEAKICRRCLCYIRHKRSCIHEFTSLLNIKPPFIKITYEIENMDNNFFSMS